MRKFIHIRGSMGTGKTTAVRQFLQITGGFVLHQITVRGEQYPFYHNKEKNIVVTGVYGKCNCEGLDGVIEDRDIMLEYLKKIIDTVNPDYMVFEAVMYGKTTKFAVDLTDILQKRGYEYKGILLLPPLEVSIMNVLNRNGGKKINMKSFKAVYKASKTAGEKIKELGMNIEVVDTSKIRYSDMHSIIGREIT